MLQRIQTTAYFNIKPKLKKHCNLFVFTVTDQHVALFHHSLRLASDVIELLIRYVSREARELLSSIMLGLSL